MSTEIEGQSLLARSDLSEATKEFKKKSMKSYTRDFLLSFTHLDICKELPSGFDRSILERSKFSYTRDFLLSFGELEICKSLPGRFDPSILCSILEKQIAPVSVSLNSSRGSKYDLSTSTKWGLGKNSQGLCGFDPSVLCKIDGTSSSILEKQRAPVSVSLNSSTGSKFDLSTSTKWGLANNSQGLCGKHDGVSSRLNNRYSPLQDICNSDTGRHYGDQSEYDGLLGSGAFSRASGGTTEALALNDHYQLKKSDNPYRPPHSYKEVPNPGVESNELCTEEASCSAASLNDERAEEEKKRRDTFKLMRKVQQIVTVENPKQIGYKQEENFEPVNVALSEDLGNDKRLLKESKKYMVLTDPSYSSASSSLEKNLGIKSLIQFPIAEHQNVDADKTQKPILHSSKFAHWFLEEEKELAGGSLSVNTKDANGGSYGLVTKHNSSFKNELPCKPVASTLAFATEGIAEQLCGCSKPTVTGILTCKDLERSILTELNVIAVKGWNVGSDQPKSAFADDASKCRNSLLQEAASPKLYLGSSNKKCSSESVSAREINQQFEKKQTLESVLGMDCIKEFQSNQVSVFVQRGSLDRVTRTDISDPCGFPFPVANENRGSITNEHGTSGTNCEGIRPANLSGQTELDMTNQSALYDNWTEIASNLRMEPKITDSTVEIVWPDEDSLIAIDDPVIPQHSKPMPNMASIIHAQQEAKLSPEAGSDDTVDSTGEICWPDEDSLIAIDDLIFPEDSMSMRSGKLTEAYKLTSNVTVDIADKSMALNVAHHDEGSTVPAVGNSPFLGGPHDTMGSGFPFHNPLSQQSNPQFHHSYVSPGRPSFHPLDSHQAQMNSQTKFTCPKSNRCNPSPHHHIDTHAYPWQTTPVKPKKFHHTVKHSQLQQSINFPCPQTDYELLRGAPPPNPIYQMAAYTQNLNPVQNFFPNTQQSSYVGFGMPNAGEKQNPLEKDAGEKTIAWLDKLRNSNGSIPTSKIRLNMQRVMQNNAAVFRMQETLEEGCQLIDKVCESFHDVKLGDRSLIWNSDLIETIELENLLINACITMHSAEARK